MSDFLTDVHNAVAEALRPLGWEQAGNFMQVTGAEYDFGGNKRGRIEVDFGYFRWRGRDHGKIQVNYRPGWQTDGVKKMSFEFTLTEWDDPKRRKAIIARIVKMAERDNAGHQAYLQRTERENAERKADRQAMVDACNVAFADMTADEMAKIVNANNWNTAPGDIYVRAKDGQAYFGIKGVPVKFSAHDIAQARLLYKQLMELALPGSAE